MRLTLVGDDSGDEVLEQALTARGHSVDRKRRGSDLLTSHHHYDAVILELCLPDLPGLLILRKLRQVTSVPVIILTTDASERSVVRGLRSGADDYLVKPARIGELTARLEAITRRAAILASSVDSVIVSGDVRVDLTARQVSVAGNPIRLTPTEFELLSILAERAGSAVSRAQLMDHVWGDAFIAVSRTLDVHMARLRTKLNRPRLIITLRGYGYQWAHDSTTVDLPATADTTAETPLAGRDIRG
ncbi:response regulator transcription factor [Nocardia sp. NBC_01730]|uniref:response regulator transcription factor n=1 Tax=Nocardia sp. NBC_01730 TaxID=2975998 RepID=UPI002E123FA3|nr:response regulator transcription factor [Nocardia sp. NBC_01730]